MVSKLLDESVIDVIHVVNVFIFSCAWMFSFGPAIRGSWGGWDGALLRDVGGGVADILCVVCVDTVSALFDDPGDGHADASERAPPKEKCDPHA